MKKLIPAVVAVSIMLMGLVSCKKENNNPSSPAPPHAAGNATVNSIALNGGNVSGRWTSYLYYDVNFQNDTFVSENTDTIAAGAEVINFLSNGIFTLWLDTMFLDSGTYVTSGNHLTAITSTNDTSIFTYGVNGNRMRWHSSSTQVIPPNVIRTEEDIVFNRY